MFLGKSPLGHIVEYLKKKVPQVGVAILVSVLHIVFSPFSESSKTPKIASSGESMER